MNLAKTWYALEPHERLRTLLDATAIQLQQELEEADRGGTPVELNSEGKDSELATRATSQDSRRTSQ
jgi:hypothetical protein